MKMARCSNKNRVTIVKHYKNKKMSWEEYAQHKESIRSMQVLKETYTITMYTITLTTIGVSIEQDNPLLCLLPYLVLFPFQRIIANMNCKIQKHAALISVFGNDIWEKEFFRIEDEFEKEYDCKDDSLPSHAKLQDKVYYLYFKVRNAILRNRWVRVSSLHLGLVCSLMNVVSILNVKNCLFNNCINTMCENEQCATKCFSSLYKNVSISCAFIFLGLMYWWCRNALKAPKWRKKYIKAMKRYRSKCILVTVVGHKKSKT